MLVLYRFIGIDSKPEHVEHFVDLEHPGIGEEEEGEHASVDDEVQDLGEEIAGELEDNAIEDKGGYGSADEEIADGHCKKSGESSTERHFPSDENGFWVEGRAFLFR